MRWCCALVVAGCGFQHGALGPDAAPGSTDSAPDATPDGPPAVTCYEKWLDHSIRFSAPTPISAINTAGYERDPFVTADELTLYYSNGDVYMTTRPVKIVPFELPAEASAFNSTSNETKVSISADGMIAVVGSDRPGGAGGVDVWESIRTSTSQQWPAMNRTNVMMVSTAGSDHDPTLSADGVHLYIAPDNPASQHLVVATRGGSGAFGATTALTELDSGTGDADPSPTPDERILAFASNRSGGGDVYYATRAAADQAFSAPRAVPDIATASAEGDPHISADGCRIYFARFLGAGYDWDIFVADAL